jgi:hypothetical protein
MKPSLRSRTVGTKVTDEEYARLESMAKDAGLTLSEWAREALLRGLPAATVAERTLLAEVLALRKVVLNLVYELASGQTPTPELMKKIIEHADAEKTQQAQARLAATGGGQ